MNKSYFDRLYMGLGIIGALVLLYGRAQDVPQVYYIIGSLALLITAIHYKLVYFIALEFIIIAGHSAILLGVGPSTRIALPILLCFQLYIFYLMVGKENSFFVLLGIIGIALLSLGFSHNNAWIFFSGSSLIAIYAYYSGYKGRRPAYIWAVLNTIFAGAALYQLLLNARGIL